MQTSKLIRFVESYSFNKDIIEVLDTYSKDTELDALGDLWDFILMLISYVPMSLDSTNGAWICYE